MQSIQCGGSNFLLNSLLTHLSLNLILPNMVAHCPVLDGWSDFRLPLCWSRKGGSSDSVTCLLWPDLFLSPTTHLSSLILVCPRPLWHPWVLPVAHSPISLSGPFIPTEFKYSFLCIGVLYILSVNKRKWDKNTIVITTNVATIFGATLSTNLMDIFGTIKKKFILRSNFLYT